MNRSLPLRLDQISKSFGSVRALKPLTLKVEPGEMLALLGPSGCGKTTTLRIIAGFEMPDTGSVHIGDRDITEVPPHRRGLGMVFQNYSLFPHMSVGENIAFGLKMRGMNAADRTQKVRSMLKLVRLDQYEDRTIHQLSGGQQQRVALARSLVTDPSVLLLDEPLGALDKNLRERMQFELRELQKQLGITAIIVTHDQEEALTMSDRIAVMSEGEVVQIGAPIEIYERPSTQFVSEFLGTANIFDAEVVGQPDDATASVKIAASDVTTTIPTTEKLSPGVQVRIAVRPERMAIDPAGEGLRARVQGIVFRGSYYAYELVVPGRDEPLYVYASNDQMVPEDGMVGVSWPGQYAILLKDRVAS